MWPFGKSKLRQAASNAEHAERLHQACVLELRKIDTTLRRLEKVLPANSSNTTLEHYRTALIIHEREAERMLHHTRNLRDSVEDFEKNVRRVKKAA